MLRTCVGGGVGLGPTRSDREVVHPTHRSPSATTGITFATWTIATPVRHCSTPLPWPGYLQTTASR